MKYISKGEWFDEGTEVVLIDDYRINPLPNLRRNAGLFEGYRNGHPDQEVCTFDEFDVIDDAKTTTPDSL